MSGPEADIDLARCALLIAGQFQPGLDIESGLSELDALAQQAGGYPVQDAQSLVEFMAGSSGFRGDSENYYSPVNSLLNRVLESRKGIPITLAIVYICVTQRLSTRSDGPSLRAFGVNFPGHFMVALTDLESEHAVAPPLADQDSADADDRHTDNRHHMPQLIDPFAGKLVSRSECYDIIRKLYGREPDERDEYFAAASNKQILLRLLENLKAIYLQKKDFSNGLICLDYQLLLYPNRETLLKQQQALLEHMRKQSKSNSHDGAAGNTHLH